ncbi:hypothetical protein ACJ4V0_18115 [Phreatobacter sp. HK31-P]
MNMKVPLGDFPWRKRNGTDFGADYSQQGVECNDALAGAKSHVSRARLLFQWPDCLMRHAGAWDGQSPLE